MLRPLALSFVFMCAAPGDAAALPVPDGAEQPQASREPPPPDKGAPEVVLPPAPLRMVSEIPRWPFIAGAFGVFLIMALFGLRRLRS